MIKKPNLFIVGAPKSGTTSMWHYLRQHPDIFMSDMKEPYFFGKDLSLEKPSFEQYLAYFSAADKEKWIGEASVWYLYSKEAAKEIHSFLPNAKIIIMLRNPVDMLYSLHSQLLHTGGEEIIDFSKALAVEKDRKQGKLIPRSCRFPEGLFYRDIGRFSEQIQRYLDIFEPANVHIIIYDDLQKDPGMVYKDVMRFLDMPLKFVPEFTIQNPNKEFRNKLIVRLVYEPSPLLVGTVKLLLPYPKWRREVQRFIKRVNTQYVPRLPLDKCLDNKLRIEFLSEIERLSNLLGKDLMYWAKPG